MKGFFLTLGIVLGSALINSIIAQPPPPTPFTIPIDQGLSLILAVGAGYGAKFLYDTYKHKATGKKEKEEDKPEM